MNGSIRVGTLFGIPFYVSASWFLVLGLVTFSYGSGLAAQFPSLPTGLAGGLGLVAALLLFASVVAHELGHSFAARRQGIQVHSITLFLFGGLAQLEKESETPAGAFWVAIAGPLVSLALFLGFTGLGMGLGLAGPWGAIVGLLASLNLVLALFNLIPGLPLDGGNVLKALVWKLTGNPYQGVQFAGRVGQVLGWAAIALGVLPFLVSGSFSGFWQVLIGGFLLQNAGRAAQSAGIQSRLARFTAAEAVTPDSPVVAASTTLRTFADMLILNNHAWQQFLVVDDQGQLVGAIAVDALRRVPAQEWGDRSVGSLLRPLSQILIQADQSLLEAAELLEREHLSALPVVQANGTLLGLLEKTTLLRLLQQSPRPAAA